MSTTHPRPSLTQLAVQDFIYNHVRATGQLPGLDLIARECELSERGLARYHVHRLVWRGMLTKPQAEGIFEATPPQHRPGPTPGKARPPAPPRTVARQGSCPQRAARIAFLIREDPWAAARFRDKFLRGGK